jgi:hypothetical protein
MERHARCSFALCFCLIVHMLMIITATDVQGAEFCVANWPELSNAFYHAEQNDEDDVIKVQQGTYSGEYGIYYSFYKAHAITIEGGVFGRLRFESERESRCNGF